MSQVTEHAKEIERRAGLPPEERRKLAEQDQKRAFDLKVEKLSRIDKVIKERDKVAQAVQADLISFSKNLSKLSELHLEIYSSLMNPDCLLDDSPIGDPYVFHWVKEFITKLDMDWLGGLALDGKAVIKPFFDKVLERKNWIRRDSLRGKNGHCNSTSFNSWGSTPGSHRHAATGCTAISRSDADLGPGWRRVGE